jgi:hypothetical protein
MMSDKYRDLMASEAYMNHAGQHSATKNIRVNDRIQ